MATPFTKSMSNYAGSPLGFLLPIFFTAYMIFKYKINFNKKSLLTVLGILVIWSIFQFLKQGYFTITTSFFLYYNIITAFIIFKIYGLSFFLMFEKFVVWLSVVSLIGWILVVIIPGPFSSLITLLGGFKDDGTITANIFIYSLTNNNYYSDYIISRNSGFAWEPGRFASILLIAIFFNITRSKFRIHKNINLFILMSAVLTTQSTTGYAGIIITIFFYFLNMSKIKKFMIVIPFIILAYLIISLPFMSEKLKSQWFDDDVVNKVEVTEGWKENDEVMVPTRLDGLALESLNFLNDFMLGYGTDQKDSFVQKTLFDRLFLANGLIKVFSKFGIFLGLIFYFMVYKFSKWHSKIFNYKGKLLYFCIFCVISTSYSFTKTPVLLSILFFPYLMSGKRFYPRNTNHKVGLNEA